MNKSESKYFNTARKMDEAYRRMFAHVFTPILERFHVPESECGYMMC